MSRGKRKKKHHHKQREVPGLGRHGGPYWGYGAPDWSVPPTSLNGDQFTGFVGYPDGAKGSDGSTGSY